MEVDDFDSAVDFCIRLEEQARAEAAKIDAARADVAVPGV